MKPSVKHDIYPHKTYLHSTSLIIESNRVWPKPDFAPQKQLLLAFSNFVQLVNLAFFINFCCKNTFCRQNLTSLCHSLESKNIKKVKKDITRFGFCRCCWNYGQTHFCAISQEKWKWKINASYKWLGTCLHKEDTKYEYVSQYVPKYWQNWPNYFSRKTFIAKKELLFHEWYFPKTHDTAPCEKPNTT